MPEVEDKIDFEAGILRIKPDTNNSYMLQFFQHFFYQSVKDDDIRPVFVDNFKNVFDNAFGSDIRRATEGLCKALTEEDSAFDKADVLTEFLKAINGSKFRKFDIIREILQQEVVPQTLLQSAIERCKADKVYLSLFGINKPEGGEGTPQKS